jgi:hypothetical protein
MAGPPEHCREDDQRKIQKQLLSEGLNHCALSTALHEYTNL